MLEAERYTLSIQPEADYVSAISSDNRVFIFTTERMRTRFCGVLPYLSAPPSFTDRVINA